MIKKIALLLLLLIIGGAYYAYESNKAKLPIITAYAAKCGCTNAFKLYRSLPNIEDTDLADGPLKFASLTRNDGQGSVSASVFGLGESTAKYREGFGCVLLDGKDDFNIKYPKKMRLTIDYPQDNILEEKSNTVDYQKLEKALDIAFKADAKTRAVVVLKGDTLLAERYAEGFDKKSPLLGWSMTKSIANTIIGMLVQDSMISIDQNYLFEEWANDDRKNITLDHLLRMSSGLEWEEEYATVSDATKMLFMAENVSVQNLDEPLAHQPGSHWYYSSGTTNLLSGLIRNTLNNDTEYWQFPKERIFRKLNMGSAFIETDEAGNFIMSSYGYASARDWGKYGLLYLNDGVWNGERLLPEGWVDYSRKLTPASGHEYGAQFWLNHESKSYPDAPSDMFSCNGYQGQRVFILPSEGLVIVRLGLNSEWDGNGFLREVLEAAR